MRGAQLVVALALLVLASCGQAAEEVAPAPAPPASESAAVEPADDAIFCQEVARRLSAADCANYEALAAGAQRGMAAFNTPNPMRRGETHVLQLAIAVPAAPAPPDIATSALPADDPAAVVEPLPGDTVEFAPLVGRFMRAELRGVGFDIEAQTPAQQEVTPESVTTWSWRVVAREGGQRALTLTTIVEGCTEAQSECIPLRSTTTNYTIDVEVRPLDRARDFLAGVPEWVKIASGIIAALAGLIFALVSLRSAVRKARS